jgi:hypothetical protein
VEILREIESTPTWSAAEVRTLLCDIAETLPWARIEWDADAGEEWARVVVDDEVECLIRAPTSVGRAHRFAFLRAQVAADKMRPPLSACQVTVVELADFDDESLSARSDDLAAFIGSIPADHVFDPRRFSANDLWFVSL